MAPLPQTFGASASLSEDEQLDGSSRDDRELLGPSKGSPSPQPRKRFDGSIPIPEAWEAMLVHPGRRKVEGGHVLDSDWIGELIGCCPTWILVAAFAAAALGSWAATGETCFGRLTGGVVQSLQLAKSQSRELLLQAHILGGSAMCFFGFVQVMCKWLRSSARLSCVHRFSGRLFLLLWALVVGPTAALLSLFVGVGSGGMQLMMTAFTVLNLETVVLAYYYLWRALRLARERASREALQLHGRAMRVGLAFTLLIVFQRPLQLILLAFRKVVLLGLAAASEPIAESLSSSILGHHAVLSLAAMIGGAGLLPFLLDGPHSGAMCCLLSVRTEEERVKFFGAAAPSPREVLLWRVRVPVYLGLRALVTAGWSSDPAKLFVGSSLLGLNTDLRTAPT